MLGPLLLIMLGVLFLLNNLYPEVFRFSKMWPVVLIVIGVAKMLEYFQKDQAEIRTPQRPRLQDEPDSIRSEKEDV